MTITLEILLFMIILRIWIILDDFKRNKGSILMNTAVFSSFLLPTLSKMPNGNNLEILSNTGGADILLYFFIVSLIIVYIILCLKMISNLIKREDIPNSIVFYIDLIIVIIPIISGVGLYFTPIIYFMYLTIPTFLYKIFSNFIYNKDKNVEGGS
ncbi:MAG: hypothetical protein ACRC2K_03005 [Clostridium sp.]